MASTGEIREWLRKNGHNPGQRGRLHPDHLKAWQDAHPNDGVEKTASVASTKVHTDTDGDVEATVRGLSMEEKETTITYTQADALVQVYSSIIRDISKMKGDKNYTLVKENKIGNSPQAWFTIPVDKFRFGSKSSRTFTPEHRAALSERASNWHKNK